MPRLNTTKLTTSKILKPRTDRPLLRVILLPYLRNRPTLSWTWEFTEESDRHGILL